MTTYDPLYRVQDYEGRGPWRPGISRRWTDKVGSPQPPSFFIEFGWSTASMRYRFFPGEYAGCGCTTLEQLMRWFTPTEARKLDRLGYHIVKIVPTRILAASENQVVFARMTPLRQNVEIIPWPSK